MGLLIHRRDRQQARVFFQMIKISGGIKKKIIYQDFSHA